MLLLLICKAGRSRRPKRLSGLQNRGSSADRIPSCQEMVAAVAGSSTVKLLSNLTDVNVAGASSDTHPTFTSIKPSQGNDIGYENPDIL